MLTTLGTSVGISPVHSGHMRTTETPISSPADLDGVTATGDHQSIVLDHCIEIGNPPDAPMLAPAIARIKKLFAKVPKNATADRGYGEAKVEADLHELGVNYVAIPRKGRPGAARQAIESSRRFRQLIKWRTGSEGRISYLKHSWGWERTMLDGIDGARTWCGWGILAHNATKIAVLTEEHETKSTVGTTAENRSTTTKRPSGRPPPPTEKIPA